jgi:hypothetical protein
VRVDLHITDGADLNCMNRFFLRYTGTLLPADATAWANSILLDWNASGNIGAQVCSSIVLTKVVLTDLTSTSSAQGIATGTEVGGSGGTPTPASTCLVVSQRFVRRYRGGHSRVYLTGFPQASLGTSPNWSSGTPAAVATAWKNFITACIASVPSGYTPVTQVNVSYYSGFTNHTFPSGRVRPIPTPRGTPLVDTITSYVGNTKVASQRRRNLQGS